MWNDNKPWWLKKAKDNQTNCDHRKNWCVIKVAVEYKHNINTWEPDFTFKHIAVGKSNAPKYWNPESNKYESSAVVDNLTKHEAHCVAKGLNFLDT